MTSPASRRLRAESSVSSVTSYLRCMKSKNLSNLCVRSSCEATSRALMDRCTAILLAVRPALFAPRHTARAGWSMPKYMAPGVMARIGSLLAAESEGILS